MVVNHLILCSFFCKIFKVRLKLNVMILKPVIKWQRTSCPRLSTVVKSRAWSL
jgi:hypothetical protein